MGKKKYLVNVTRMERRNVTPPGNAECQTHPLPPVPRRAKGHKHRNMIVRVVRRPLVLEAIIALRVSLRNEIFSTKKTNIVVSEKKLRFIGEEIETPLYTNPI